MPYTIPPQTIEQNYQFFATTTTYQISRGATDNVDQNDLEADQGWFSSESWQAGEREASADIESGNVVVYENDEDFLASL